MDNEEPQQKDNIQSISMLPTKAEIGGRNDWGNKLVVNTGRTPVVNFAFMLRVEGAFDLPCKAVKGIHRENEFDYIQEGGLNDYVHLKRKPISKPFTFQVERYVGVNWVDPLPLGTELLLPVILFVNKHVFPGLQPVRNYVFTGCTVISKDYGELNAEVSGLLLETVTIAYREMVCLDIPSETFEQDKDSGKVWKFDGKKREGSGQRHYNSNLFNKEWETQYSSSEKMEKKAKEGRWTPKKDADGRVKSKHGKNYESFVTDYNKAIDKEIQSAETEAEKEAAKAKKIAMSASTKRLWPEQSSATHLKGELSRSEMEKKSAENMWTPEKDEDGHLKTKHGRDYKSFATDFNKEIEKEIAAAETEKAKQEAEAKRIALSAAANRIWPAQSSAARQEMKTPEAKQYQHSATPKQYSSAKHLEGELSRSEMEKKSAENMWAPEKDEGGRLKAKYGRDYKSFATDFNKEIEKEIAAAETEKAKQEAEAKKIVLSAAANRIWPAQSSAARQEMKTPEARLWPKKKSAKEITDFLKKN